MNPKHLADQINKDCDELRYFWAYGALKASFRVWSNNNANLLNKEARTILRDISRVKLNSEHN